MILHVLSAKKYNDHHIACINLVNCIHYTGAGSKFMIKYIGVLRGQRGLAPPKIG